MSKPDDFSHVVDYILQQSTDKKQLRRALDGLLSTNEQQELCQRLRIFELLSQGLPQRDVAKRLGVGIATVSRGSKVLQTGDYFANVATAINNKSSRSYEAAKPVQEK